MWPKDIQKANELYQQAKDAYYNGQPIMSDLDFDQMESWLEDNDSSFEKTVGAPVSGVAQKYKHWTPMLSLDKIQAKRGDSNLLQLNEDFDTWTTRAFKSASGTGIGFNNSDTIILPKYDGLALNVQYRNGKLVKALTRGDKLEGKDVKDLLTWLPNNLESPHNIEIRGEIVLPKETFNSHPYFKGQQNPRNSASGLLGREDRLPVHDELHFVPFEIRVYDEVDAGILEYIDCVHPNNFIKYIHWTENIRKPDYFVDKGLRDNYETMLKYRQECVYQLDGIVYTIFDFQFRRAVGESSNTPNWSLAIKFIPTEVYANIIDIEWNMGKTGEFTPVAVFDPVELDGTQVTKASLHNVGYIESKNAKIGAQVLIEKAGDIIPQIIEVVEDGHTYHIPKSCPHCGTELNRDGVHLTCQNSDCSGINSKQFITNLNHLELDHVGPRTAQILFESNQFKTVFDLLNPVKNSVSYLVGAGLVDGSNVRKINKQLESIDSISLEKVILGMGVPNLGPSIAKAIAVWWVYSIEDFHGLDRSVINSFVNGDNSNRLADILDDLEEWNIRIIEPEDPAQAQQKIIQSISIEMTGSPKPDWKTKSEFLKQFSGVVHTKLDTADFLITDDLSSTTVKMKKANQLGIEIMTYQEFFKKYGK